MGSERPGIFLDLYPVSLIDISDFVPANDETMNGSFGAIKIFDSHPKLRLSQLWQ